MHKIKLLSLKQEWATIINRALKLYTAYSTTLLIFSCAIKSRGSLLGCKTVVVVVVPVCLTPSTL